MPEPTLPPTPPHPVHDAAAPASEGAVDPRDTATPAGPTQPACACCAHGAEAAPGVPGAPATPATRGPAWLPAAVVVTLLVVGLLLGGPVGAVVAGLGAVALTVVTALAWRRAEPGERLMRLAVLVLVVGLCLVRFVPR
ncbi:hypothetical protein [Agilicoccus flavus]|uniref:hypothetical protein n=1 Tax=Agilicoccus flavus TaxID=2775968 RepID=UPI001CF660E2|nr:hypothetical protein [Agilicoccus flavus]